MSSSAQPLADAIAATARQQGATTPQVRGADWHTAQVTAVNTNGTIDCGTIRARRLDSYANPRVGDLVAVSRSGAGNWLILGRLATTAGTAWTTYTPAWTGATTNPAIGNGSLVGRYSRSGRTITCHVELTPGSSTTFGSGAYRYGLPVPVADTGCNYVGSAHLFQSTTDRWAGQALATPATSEAAVFFSNTASDPRLRFHSPTAPGVFAPGHILRFTVTYESAT